MSKDQLGEFEELILTIVGVLDNAAYGNSIVKEIKTLLDRDVNLSAVHITLYRLEDKGHVKSEMRGATSSRGGRRKRYFKITSSGLNLLYALQEQRRRLWKLLPDLNFGSSNG
ncbi:MAG: helix-turn-helix transcriptional regulator [Reichenbachiella sp.]|uniref:PadR family transcriptional regulator n=1 Tax=Reichenbachiella sp. TaxID=2184521 RepID=UPI0032633EDE